MKGEGAAADLVRVIRKIAQKPHTPRRGWLNASGVWATQIRFRIHRPGQPAAFFKILIRPDLEDLLKANVNDVAELRSSRGHLAQIKEVRIEGVVSSWRRVNGAAAFEDASSVLREVQAGH